MSKKAEALHEDAFLACSCWMAHSFNRNGRKGDVSAQLERVLAVANDPGPLSEGGPEECSMLGRHLARNFPQTLTHLAVADTASRLGGPLLERVRS